MFAIGLPLIAGPWDVLETAVRLLGITSVCTVSAHMSGCNG